jgi:Holliday junction resolvasome RuvABC endonuclease subunit
MDPSLTAFGWAVLLDGVVLEAGCIQTKPSSKKLRIRKGDDKTRRISEVNLTLMSLIKSHNICYLLAELPHGSQSATAASALAIVTTIIQCLSDFYEIGIEWYSEQDSKKCVLGKKEAAKIEMINAISKHYPSVKWNEIKYKDEAIADAIAIHYTAKKMSPFIKGML